MNTVALFRSCKPNGDHFYTTNKSELQNLRDQYQLELEGFEGHLAANPEVGTAPFHRLFGPGGHLYTASGQEVQSAIANSGYRVEGVIGHIATAQLPGTTALYRLRHPGIVDYFYTINAAERDAAVRAGWVNEGISGYVWTAARCGQIQEQFYAKESKQQWWVGIQYKDGSWTPGFGIPQEWHRRTYRVGPAGHRLISYSARETTKNNDATWTDEERGGSHYVTLAVEDRALFGTSNWVGVEVTYEIERGY